MTNPNAEDDPIGHALAIAVEAIDEHGGKRRYQHPILAGRIGRVRAELEQLYLRIGRVFKPPAIAPDDGIKPRAGREDGAASLGVAGAAFRAPEAQAK